MKREKHNLGDSLVMDDTDFLLFVDLKFENCFMLQPSQSKRDVLPSVKTIKAPTVQ